MVLGGDLGLGWMGAVLDACVVQLPERVLVQDSFVSMGLGPALHVGEELVKLGRAFE